MGDAGEVPVCGSGVYDDAGGSDDAVFLDVGNLSSEDINTYLASECEREREITLPPETSSSSPTPWHPAQFHKHGSLPQ